MLTREAIQERSYKIWEREGRPFGRDLDHWRRAEMELIAELERLHDEAKSFVEAEAPAKPKKKAAKSAKPETSEAPKPPRKRARKAAAAN